MIPLAPAADHELRLLRHERAWRAACSAITPLDVMTSADYARPITEVMPMGGLMNVDRTGDPGVVGIIAVVDAVCHTDPGFAYGLSFALAHAQALAHATAEAPDGGAIVERYRADAGPEACERDALACATDAARSLRWKGEPLEIGRRDSCYPLFSFVGALAAAPHDDGVLRRTPSVASVYSTAPPYSTRTTPCMTESKPSSASLRRLQRRRQARPVRSCWLGWQRLGTRSSRCLVPRRL